MENASYAVQQRLRLFDFLLAHYDCVGREQLCDFFGISAPQATRDIRMYRELAPNNVIFDGAAKKYRRAVGFARVFQ